MLHILASSFIDYSKSALTDNGVDIAFHKLNEKLNH